MSQRPVTGLLQRQRRCQAVRAGAYGAHTLAAAPVNAARLQTGIGVIIVLLCLAACQRAQPLVEPDAPAYAALAMPDEFSGAAAEWVFDEGGNAVDAAVAAAFALAVTYPEAGNIGGGGFMLVYFDGVADFLDYRELAPAAATQTMYLDEGGDVIEGLSLTGHRAVAVPGTVAGLWAAHRRYGTIAWEALLQPAIRLASEGFAAPGQLVERVQEELERFEGKTNFAAYFTPMETGRIFRQPELAATLERIAKQGRNDFYRGETARLIAAEMAAGGGLLNAADIAAYEAVWRSPLRSPWREYQIVTAPPPSSGGFAVIQLLRMKDHLKADFDGLEHNSAQYLHLIAEMEKRVFADRAEYFGDPDFVDVPIGQLLDEDYIMARSAEVQSDRISSPGDALPGLESVHTTHFCIVDRNGNAVANTYTLNTWFGSGVVVEGAGFLLNNEMDDFSAKPDVPNYFGVTGGSANAIAPRKRMLSSMSPTILLRDGGVEMVVGTPGGSTIFTSVFQAVVNILDFDMTPVEAASAPRFHHQLLPADLITYSPSRPIARETIDALRARGYRVRPHDWEFGDVQVIVRHGDGYSAGSDPRGRGKSNVIHYDREDTVRAR